MSKKRSEELKNHFRTQVLIGDRKFQDFYGLLHKAQTYVGKPQLRLAPYQMDELHGIYTHFPQIWLSFSLNLPWMASQ